MKDEVKIIHPTMNILQGCLLLSKKIRCIDCLMLDYIPTKGYFCEEHVFY